MSSKTKSIVLIGVMTAVIAVLSVWQIPLPLGVPMTFQVFGAALSGYALGAKKGFVAQGLYTALGCVGVPVFSGFVGGAAHLAGPTGGFVAGFLAIAFLCGAFRNKGTLLAIAAGSAGLFLCHAVGTLHYSFVMDAELFASFLVVSLPYIVKDAALVSAAYFVSRPVVRAVIKGL